MDILSKEEFIELSANRSDYCVSIVMPTHQSGVEVNEKQDQSRFKNALQQVREALKAKGLEGTSIEALLKPGIELLGDESFWHSQLKSLSVFMANDFYKTIKMPIPVKEEIIVNRSFYITPLLPLIASKEHFYLLVFSKQYTKLYKGDEFDMHEVTVEGLPYGIDDVIHFEEKDDLKTYRGGGTSTPGSGASFHGQGSGLADDKEYISQYLKEVDQTLWKEVLSTQHVPLVLAAVEFMAAIFKQISQYQYIEEEVMLGNFEGIDKNTLFEKARKKIDPYFKEKRKKALQQYYNKSATALTSSIPADVIPASYYGRIVDLFVKKDEHIWGSFDEAANKLALHEEEQEGDECLLDKAVVRTIMNGGNVYVLEADEMPNESSMAALMRYEA